MLKGIVEKEIWQGFLEKGFFGEVLKEVFEGSGHTATPLLAHRCRVR